MKKKSILASSCALVFIILGTASSAFATSYTDASHSTSNATITFEEDKEAGPIVDPTNPTDPILPDGPVNPTGSELMITYTSDLNFGTQSKQNKTWNALGEQVTDVNSGNTRNIAPFISVKDTRGTSRKGWSLTVKQDEDFKDTDGKVLTGAELSYSNLVSALTVGAPTVKSGVISIGKDAAEFASADTNTGVGSWSIGLGSYDTELGTTNGVTLKVPTTTAKNTGSYSTTLTYELISDPTK